MPIDGELIFVALITTAGMILTTQLWQMNWFRRENFKIQKKNVMDENRLKMKKLEREMGLTGATRAAPEEKGLIEKATDWLPIISKLEPEQISAFADKFLDVGGGEGELPDSITDIILSYAEQHPEVVKSFIEGVGSKIPKQPPQEPGF